jgi:CIC family chloride channel protein
MSIGSAGPLQARIAHFWHAHPHGRWTILGIVTGTIAGLGASAFFVLIEATSALILRVGAGFDLPGAAGEELFHVPVGPWRPWVVLGALVVVAGLTAFLVRRFLHGMPPGGTDGTDTLIHTFHHREGRLDLRIPVVRVSTAILTIAAGGSAGREGPMSLLGAGCAAWLADRLGLSAKERRLLLLVGAAGGLGAIFRAPLGGALTAVEVLYREDFEARALAPSILSSVTAYSVFAVFFGTDPIFRVPELMFTTMAELPLYAVLGLACAGAGMGFVRFFRWVKTQLFGELARRVGPGGSMVLGAVAMGLLAMAFPALAGGGYGYLQLAIEGRLETVTLLLLALGKTLATSMVLGSGLSGGMFAPALLVGGMVGGVVGRVAQDLAPSLVGHPEAYVLVGMAAFFAGIARAPVGPLVMVCELTRGYGLLVPLMLASAVSLAACRRTFLYDHQVDDKFASPAHADETVINVLERLRVADSLTPRPVACLREGAGFREMTDLMIHSTDHVFPVLGDDGQVRGAVTLHDVRAVLFEDVLCPLVVARDILRPCPTLTPDDDVSSALLRFVESDLPQLPVVDPASGQVLGLLDRGDVFRAYARGLAWLRGSAAV